MSHKNQLSLKKQRIFEIITLCLSIMIMLIIFELAFRLTNPAGKAKLGLLFGIQPESSYETDKNLGYRPKDKLYFWDDEQDPPTPEKQPSTIRVFALGDSFVKEHGVGKENEFYRQVEDELNGFSENTKYKFFHFGVSGYSEVQFLELLRRYGPLYNPDWAIIQVYLGNDIGENAGLIIRELGLAEVGSAAGKLAIKEVIPNSKPSFLGKTRSIIRKNCFFCKFVYDRVPVVIYKIFGSNKFIKKDSNGNEVLDNINTGSHFISLMKKETTPEIEQAWKITDNLIKEISDEAIKQNINVVFILIPQELQVNRQAWKEASDMLGLNTSYYDVDLPSKRFKALLTKYDLSTIDLTPDFRAAINSGFDLYDGHFSREGHDMAAELIFQEFINLGWIGEGVKQ